MGLTRIAITRPVFMLMLMLVALLLGTISFKGMRVEQNPEVSFGVISVSTIYPGAGPEELETLVSRKIEEAVSGVNGFRDVTSTSQEGISVVTANFELGTNMDSALNECRAKVDAIVGQLPSGIEKPTISKLDTASEPVLYMAIRSDVLNNQELRDLADEKLKDRFAKIAGVSSVNVSGGDVREIQVRLKRDRLLAYNIGVLQVQRAVQAATLNVPSGRIVDGREEYSVRVLGEFKTLDQLEQLELHISDPNNPNNPGKVIRLRDVADIADSVRERTEISRLNGSESVIMVIQKAREGNAVEISKAASAEIEKIKTAFSGQKLEFIKTRDSAKFIEESLFDLNFALFFGIALVALTVYVFLHNLRGTMIVSIAIPICIFATFIAMKLLGFTVNNLSMLALSLAVGVLVDDAIVVLENIYRHLKMGEDPRDAAINGRAEIGLAAIAITLADVVVFLPIGFMGGIVGQFFKPLGLGFAVCVIISLFVSFTITPMLASRWYRKGEDVEHATGRFATWFERTFGRFERHYRGILEWSLNHRWFVFSAGFTVLFGIFMMIGGSFAKNMQGAVQAGIPLTMVAVIIGVIVFAINLIRRRFAPKLILSGLLFGLAFPVFAVIGFAWAQWKGDALFKFAFFPPSDGGQVTVEVQLPPGSSLKATEEVVDRVEKIVSKHPDTKYVVSRVGSAGGGGGFSVATQGSQNAQITVTLNDKVALLDYVMFWVKHKEKLRSRADTSIAADILAMIGKVPGAKVKVSTGSAVGFGSPIQMAFKGTNREEIINVASEVARRLDNREIKGLINVDLSSKPGKPEIRAIPNRTRLADIGITVADIATALRVLYEGNKDTKFRVNGREYDIRVMMDYGDRNNPDGVLAVPVSFSGGKPVYLSSVADIVRGVGTDKIDRRDREQEIKLTADLLPGFAAGTVQAEIDAWLVKEKLIPAGVTLKPLGQADFQKQEGSYLMSALFLGVILVYMLLASLYDNLLYPFIIQLAQPQAMTGALLALMITDKTLNIVGFIGIIALVGLVGKNAILLVDYTNTLRARGRDRHDALVEAGPTRLRPIAMTTIALVLGMLPVALAIGRGSEFRETIGITIIGGITLSTFLTLLVIPCSYTIFDDMSNWIGGKLRKAPSGPPANMPVASLEPSEEESPK